MSGLGFSANALDEGDNSAVSAQDDISMTDISNTAEDAEKTEDDKETGEFLKGES